MASQHPSAPSRASSRVRAGTPRSGVIHVNTWHASQYTVIGNHLLQHRELSATAIGVAAYIQSLPDGAPVGIKALTERFPEGRPGSAPPCGSWSATATWNAEPSDSPPAGWQPARTRTTSRRPPRAGRLLRRTGSPYRTRSQTRSQTRTGTGSRCRHRRRTPHRGRVRVRVWGRDRGQGPGGSRSGGLRPRRSRILHPNHGNCTPARPICSCGLRRYDPRLLLAERDVVRLAPGVSTWLDRGADPEAVGLALTANLPEPMRSPASVLAYRLTALLPPRLPQAPAARPVRRPDPFQTCDGCERAFRAPHPGRCRDCPPASAVGVAA